jgi:hypothetical protein
MFYLEIEKVKNNKIISKKRCLLPQAPSPTITSFFRIAAMLFLYLVKKTCKMIRKIK